MGEEAAACMISCILLRMVRRGVFKAKGLALGGVLNSSPASAALLPSGLVGLGGRMSTIWREAGMVYFQRSRSRPPLCLCIIECVDGHLVSVYMACEGLSFNQHHFVRDSDRDRADLAACQRSHPLLGVADFFRQSVLAVLLLAVVSLAGSGTSAA